MANKHLRRLRPAQLFSSSSSFNDLKTLRQSEFNNTHYHQYHPHYLHRHQSNNSNTNTKAAGMRQIINCFPMPGSDAGGYQGDDEDEDIMIKPMNHDHELECHGSCMDGGGAHYQTNYNSKRKRAWKQSLHRSHSCSKLKLMPSIKSLLSHHHRSSGSLESIYKGHTMDNNNNKGVVSNVPYMLHHNMKIDSNGSHKLSLNHHKNESNMSNLTYTRSRSLPSLNKLEDAFLHDNSHHQHHHNHHHRVNTPKGHVAIYVNYGSDRFVVPIPYLSHPDFQPLLLKAQDEFGFCQKAGLVLPCSIVEFQDVISRIQSPDSSPRSHGSKHHHNHPTKLIPQLLHNTFSKSSPEKILSKGSSLRLAWSHSDSSLSSSPSSRGKGA